MKSRMGDTVKSSAEFRAAGRAEGKLHYDVDRALELRWSGAQGRIKQRTEDTEVRIGLIWLRIGKREALLQTR